MAKLNKNTFSPISSSSIQDPVVFVVDMINGFIEEGALHDERIRGIVPAIQKLLHTLDCPSIFVCDQHDPDARDFQSYPTHCVIHTQESEIIDALDNMATSIEEANDCINELDDIEGLRIYG